MDSASPRFDAFVGDLPGEPAIESLAFGTADLAAWDSSLPSFLHRGMAYCEDHGLEFDGGGLPEDLRALLAMARAVPERGVAERLGETLDPLPLQMQGTYDEVALTLSSMRRAIEDSRGAFSSDSGIGYQMEGALVSLQGAADALRALAISLERNPDMLLRGREADED